MPENPMCKTIRFSLNGPIRTGISLDTRALIGKDARSILSNLNNKLVLPGTGWTVYAHESHDMDISIETRRESIVKPPYLAKFSFDKSEIASMQEKIRTPNDKPQIASFLEKTLLKTLHLRFFSFEYATFYAEFNIKGENHNLDFNMLRQYVEELSHGQIIGQFKQLFSERIEQFRSVAQEVEKTEEKLKLKSQDEPELEAKNSEHSPIPRWAHRIYGIQFEDIEGITESSGKIEDLIYTSSDTELEDLYPRDGASIYVASGNSALLTTEVDAESAWENLNEIVEFQNVFFAKAEDLDEELLRLVNEISLEKVRARRDRKRRNKLDDYAIKIVDTREEVLIFKNDVSDYEGHLDPDSKKIWTGLWKQWETGSKFDQIERQIDILGGLYDRIYNAIEPKSDETSGCFRSYIHTNQWIISICRYLQLYAG